MEIKLQIHLHSTFLFYTQGVTMDDSSEQEDLNDNSIGPHNSTTIGETYKVTLDSSINYMLVRKSNKVPSNIH